MDGDIDNIIGDNDDDDEDVDVDSVDSLFEEIEIDDDHNNTLLPDLILDTNLNFNNNGSNNQMETMIKMNQKLMNLLNVKEKEEQKDKQQIQLLTQRLHNIEEKLSTISISK